MDWARRARAIKRIESVMSEEGLEPAPEFARRLEAFRAEKAARGQSPPSPADPQRTATLQAQGAAIKARKDALQAPQAQQHASVTERKAAREPTNLRAQREAERARQQVQAAERQRRRPQGPQR